MILSFSVPEKNPRYRTICDWYDSFETKEKKMERSREFRNIMIAYLEGGTLTKEATKAAVAATMIPQLDRLDIVENLTGEDLDLKLDQMNIREF